MFNKIAAVLLSLVLVSACSNGRFVGFGDATGAGQVVPGTQSDLEANIGDRVFFAFDRSDLSAEAQETLKRQASWLQQYNNATVTIEGHADERGTREYNIGLGERRANSAKKYLVSLGVSADRITTVSYGKERPVIAGATSEEEHTKNRRAVTVINN
ncbi:peptidoglycan-associated lipoprotein Pal [Rickettsiales endosymbiont of Stachyamoeba lipophora]|uniref:peptidoglycan-associated lipoprotein Pal n=1 Tax=Rickettsiales endosymbiont of Stachyamoeba lipophora TaxID=2486578 RepID=UPI000F6538AC|nr:peptidoglycan-associated lipoprotein Pal [Rickettsiales endosymbiont of Stachyamoeba lipophora]AZL15439.1 peptidoglycan-associated lipoprotein Pal [Rickettsiales endosymbiont of Stachyamoeba lipophora]